MALKRGWMAALAAACLLMTGCAADSTQKATPTQSPTAAPTATAAAMQPERKTAVGFYFDTVVTLTLYGAEDGLLEDVWAACTRYEQLLSKTIDGSDVDRINKANGQPVQVDPETWTILREAQEINRASGGAFSITIAPITAMWDFTGGTARMPTDEQRIAALPLVDDTRLQLGEDGTVTLPVGMEIDLGGIAKGYIADKVAAIVRERCYGATISLGGNTYVVGHKPGGALWAVGIQDPNRETGVPLLKLSLQDGTVVTSGVYERYFKIDGKRYHHILDPKTGLPAETGLTSATVVCASSMEADALATACIVLGADEAIRLLESRGADGVIIREDGTILQTKDFTARYDLQPI